MDAEELRELRELRELTGPGEPGEQEDPPTHVRVRVEMVLEIGDADELARAAFSRIDADESMPEEERAQAAEAVSLDAAEAVAYLVDPMELADRIPGTELARATWSSEPGHGDPETLWAEEDTYDDFSLRGAGGSDPEDFDVDEFDGFDDVDDVDDLEEFEEPEDDDLFGDAFDDTGEADGPASEAAGEAAAGKEGLGRLGAR